MKTVVGVLMFFLFSFLLIVIAKIFVGGPMPNFTPTTQSTPETDIETIARLRNKREAAEATEERQRRAMETLILIEQMKQK
jgi:Na+-transporting methylmalonyl-CoA/oxaloacetate decarboxylase gamma subunit